MGIKCKVYIAGDHAGFVLKNKVGAWLEKQGCRVEDLGPFEYRKDDDYPDYAIPLARKVAKDKGSYGVIIAGSGIGECIVANKVKGIRAVLFHGKSRKVLEISRKHDDANVLCFGSWFVNEKEARQAVSFWLGTRFSGALRHKRRLRKIERFERR